MSFIDYAVAVSRLSRRQIFYRLWRGVQRFLPAKGLVLPDISAVRPVSGPPRGLNFGDFSRSNSINFLADDVREFIFLGRSKKFIGEPDWGFSEYGKLWNYNLQYFSFFTETLSKEEGLFLLRSFYDYVNSHPSALEPYPVSLRIINLSKWLMSHAEFDVDSKTFLLRNLRAELDWLCHNLEYHVDGNHLLENAIALCIGALLCGEGVAESSFDFADSATENFDMGLVLLDECLNRQILPDGGHYELCPMYHLILTHRLLDLYNMVSAAGLDYLAEKLHPVLKSMLNFASGLSCDDSWPLFSDAAISQASRLSELFAYATSLGFDFDCTTADKPELSHFKHSGYVRYQNRLGTFFIDLGAFGAPEVPGHAHADALHLLLQKGDRHLICDTGTSTYEDSDRRRQEKSAAAHNTVVIKGRAQAFFMKSFRVGRRAVCEPENTVQYYEPGKLLRLKGSLLYPPESLRSFLWGFLCGTAPVKHERSFIFRESELCIEDRLTRNGNPYTQKPAMAFFHVPGRDCRLSEPGSKDSVHTVLCPTTGLKFEFTGADSIELTPVQISTDFNSFQEATRITVTFSGGLLKTRLF
jgi:hypothetical protein